MWPGLSSGELIKRAQRARSRSNPLALIDAKMRRGDVPRCDDEIQLPHSSAAASLSVRTCVCLCAYVFVCVYYVDVLNSQQD